MLAALLFTLAPLALAQDPPAPPKPEARPPATAGPEKVEATIDALERAFGKGEAGERLRAVQTAAGVEDAKVVKLVAKGLRDKDLAVQKAAIEVLRFSAHPAALEPLHAQAKRADVRKDPAAYATILRAIGQHGSPESIAVLTDSPWMPQDHAVIEARILGLGRIRTKDSVKALIDLTEVAGPNKIEPFMRHFRASLCALTGVDQGNSRELWQRWWRENKDRLEIAKQPGEMPGELQRYWDRYWAPPGEPERRGEGAGERGGERKRRDGEGPGRGDRPPDGETPPKPDAPPDAPPGKDPERPPR
jgi:hypothetical protein